MTNTTVLIVEDEAIVAADLAGKLGQLGYDVVGTAAAGEDAVEMACRLQPGVVLMDIQLKGSMDGIQAAKEIRSKIDLPVIFLTAHSDSATLERAMLTGPFGYILKPFEERELATNIEMALFKHQAERKLRQAHDELEQRVEERTRELQDAEQELRVINETLEQRVAERTAELEATNASLRDSRRATLNMMEDAVAASRQSEETTKALRESEERVRRKLDSILSPEGEMEDLELADIIDARSMQSLMDNFYRLTRMPMGMIDLKGQVLVGVGWQDVCTKFHRVHPESCANCIESDTLLTSGVPHGEYKLYKCKNNMWDVATPIIVGGRHFGNFFMGQFIFEDEEVDYEFFRSQAKQYGFAEEEYIAALERVPRMSRESLAAGMAYFTELADMISRMSYSNLKLARSLAERDTLMDSLRESEHFYSQTLESIPGMVFTTRPDGYCDYQSSQWVEFTGVPMIEHLGDGWNKLLHPDDRLRAFDAWRAAVEVRAPYNLEYRVRRHDGEFEWFKVIGRPILDAAGQIIKWFGVAANIDAIKRGEEELLQAKEAAEAANRAKSQFLANMSHELRTPMGGVLGMLELALAGNMDAQQREYLDTAIKSGRSLLRILNDILDQSRIEAGKLSLEQHSFSLGECVSSAVELLSLEARRKGLDITQTLADGVPKCVVGDQLRLHQVLLNLIGNAVKFTEQGRIAIKISAGSTTPAGKREVTFAISDSGIGFDTEQQGMLFDSFRQADDSHTRIFGGTGLGLTISKEIVELMGGTIAVESQKGVGSTFTVCIAFEEGQEETAAEEAGPREKPAPAVTAPAAEADHSPLLLIAEDDPTNRQILSQIFKMHKIESESATNGLEAVEMWERGNFDLIIMDVQMPRLDGFAATRSIREKERQRGGHTLILAMTAHASREDEQRCLDAGMDAFISKPVDLAKAIEVVKGMVGSRS